MQQNEEKCAGKEQIYEYFETKQFILFEIKNFIDYRKVGGETIQKFSKIQIVKNLGDLPEDEETGYHKHFFYMIAIISLKANLIETQVSLQDNLWQFFVQPHDFSFLNFNPIFSETRMQIVAENNNNAVNAD